MQDLFSIPLAMGLLGDLEDFMPFIIIGGVILFIVGGVLVGSYFEKKRRENLLAAAEEMGLSYFPDGNPDLQSRMSRFGLFNTGHSKKLNNLILGDTDEVRIAIFDYSYTTGSGKNKSTSRQTIAALESDSLNPIPEFSMRPESMFHKIGGVFGMQDIDFDSHPEFSKMFLLKGPEETEIRSLFRPILLDFFEQKKGVCVEAGPGSLIFYRSRKKVPPEEIKVLLEEAYQVFGAIVDPEAKS